MAWEFDSKTPIYLQIMDEVIKRIVVGVYPPGSQIPSVRVLAQEAAVNPNTMQKALTELEREGLMHPFRTSGRFITDDAELIALYRRKLASKHTSQYLNYMKSLGLSEEDIYSVIEEERRKGQ